MAVTDLQAWADNLEIVRLPEIESSLATLQTDTSATAVLLAQKSQEFTDGLDAHTVQIGVAQITADLADSRAITAQAQLYQMLVDAQTYTNTKIQELRDYIDASVGTVNTYLNGDFTAGVNATIAGVSPALQSQVDAAVAQAQAAADSVNTMLGQANTVVSEVLDNAFPSLQAQADGLDALLTALSTDYDALTAGLETPSIVESFDAVRAENEAALVPIGGSVLRTPATLWTYASDGEFTSLVKPVVNFGTFVTDDPDFGECFDFDTGVNENIGPAYPVDFEAGRVYKVVAKVKCVNDGTTSGARVSMGVSTQKGTALLEANKQSIIHDPLSVADGSKIITWYFSTDDAAMTAYGLSGIQRYVLDATVSAAANKAYVHVRQNGSGNTNGILRIGSIFITDVTEVLKGVNTLRTSLQSNIDGVSANLTQNYLTSAQTNAAIAASETLLQTEIDGTNATVSTQGAAISTLQGNASAGYLIQAQAGNEVSLLQLVAADGSNNQVSVARLAADQILLDGSVSLNSLTTGLGGNLLDDTRWATGAAARIGFYSNTAGLSSAHAASIRPAGVSYSGRTYPVMQIRQEGTQTGSCFIYVRPVGATNPADKGAAATPGRWYEVSCYIATHRCTGTLYVTFRDENGASVGNANVPIDEQPGDSTNPENWVRYWVKGVAPENTQTVHLVIEKQATGAGSDSYVFLHKPFIGETHEDATGPTPYSDGGLVHISGGQVIADTLMASAVNTADFAAAGLAVFGNALKSTNFNGVIDGSGNIVEEGTAGWAIGKSGSMVLNNLVARKSIQVGAVSDGVTWSRDGEATFTNWAALTSPYLGSFSLGHFWQIACRVKYRSHHVNKYFSGGGQKGDPSPFTNWTISQPHLQMRTKNSGVWSGWSVIHVFPASGTDLNWRDHEVVVSKMGNYEDVQLILNVYTYTYTHSGHTGWPAGTFNNIDDATLVARALVR